MKSKLRTIFTQTGDQGEKIEVQYDRNSHLYVNGKKLLTEKKVSLRGYELALLTLTTIGVLIQAIVVAIPCINRLINFSN